jgi:hypothetical protein
MPLKINIVNSDAALLAIENNVFGKYNNPKVNSSGQAYKPGELINAASCQLLISRKDIHLRSFCHRN